MRAFCSHTQQDVCLRSTHFFSPVSLNQLGESHLHVVRWSHAERLRIQLREQSNVIKS